MGISCSKQPKNTVQLRAATGPEAKAGCLAEGGGRDVAGGREEERRGLPTPTRPLQTSKNSPGSGCSLGSARHTDAQGCSCKAKHLSAVEVGEPPAPGRRTCGAVAESTRVCVETPSVLPRGRLTERSLPPLAALEPAVEAGRASRL